MVPCNLGRGACTPPFQGRKTTATKTTWQSCPKLLAQHGWTERWLRTSLCCIRLVCDAAGCSGARGEVLAFSSEAGVGALVSCCFDGNLRLQITFLPSALKVPFFLVQWSLWVRRAWTENTSMLSSNKTSLFFLQEGSAFFPLSPWWTESSL